MISDKIDEKLAKQCLEMYLEDASMTDVSNVISDSLNLGRTQSMQHAHTIWNANFDEAYVPLNQRGKAPAPKNETESREKSKFSQSSKNDATAESSGGGRVKTLEDLLKICEVDRKVWRVDRHDLNKWEVGAKDNDGNIVTSPLYQVKAKLVRREENKIKPVIDFFRREIESVKSKPVSALPKKDSSLMYEISIPDLHVGKLAWTPETGTDPYDIKEARRLFREAAAELVERVGDISKLKQVVIPVGNDFFNSEGLSKATTKGTPQDDDGRWPKSFMAGCSLITELVDELYQDVEVKIIITPGNHDQERCFYLGEYLNAWYRNNERVEVDNAPKLRKYHKFGINLIGWTHGSEEKHADLPMIMARECKDFSSCSSYHFHLGHLHHDWLRDMKGVKVRVLPSLVPPDFWHSSKGYLGSQRSAVGILYDAKKGEVANYYYNV